MLFKNNLLGLEGEIAQPHSEVGSETMSVVPRPTAAVQRRQSSVLVPLDPPFLHMFWFRSPVMTFDQIVSNCHVQT